MATRFGRGLIRGCLRARAVPVFGPSDVGGEWVWSVSGPWLCAVWRGWRLYWCYLRLLSFVVEVLVQIPRFGRCSCLGTALLPVVPTYSRGSGDIGIIQYVGYSKD